MAEEVKWTDEQKQAIYEKDSNILVAAAAGSGKTAVLVERIINKIINEKIDIDKLLVVTFTNAAASEMRERILDAIYKKLEEDSENENLQRQITLLNKASICTIDSFCLEVVRNNFYELDNVSPNFRIADTTEIELLKQEVLEDIFEKKYEEDNDEFIKLIHTYTSYRDDTPLKELVLKINNYIHARTGFIIGADRGQPEAPLPSPTAGLIFCLISAAQRRTPGDLERISGGPSAYSTLDQRFFVTSRISFIWFASASKILPASSSSCPDTAFASSIRFVFSKHFTFSRSWLQR